MKAALAPRYGPADVVHVTEVLEPVGGVGEVLVKVYVATDPVAMLREIVGSGRYVDAYNLCDGTRTQAEVDKVAKVDQSPFSRTSSRWIQGGCPSSNSAPGVTWN
jgi:hypothetical protein